MARMAYALLLLCLIVSGPAISSADRNFILTNQCSYTVWPALLSNEGQATLWQGGTTLTPGASYQYVAPTSWAGRLWGRTGCAFDSTGAGSCQTGDCGRGLLCNGIGGVPPASLAEFTLDGYNGQDFYDVSLVDGYNLPMNIVPTTNSSTAAPSTNSSVPAYCGSPGCSADLNPSCPSELQVLANQTIVACRSACDKFQTGQYCCSGAYNSPSLCGPTDYSRIFKSACPTAYSYAYDDASSTFQCGSPAAYTITFCPSGTSSGVGSPPAAVSAPPPPGAAVVPPPPSSVLVPPPPLTLAPPPPPAVVSAPPPPGVVAPPPPPGVAAAPPPPGDGVLLPPPPPLNISIPPPPPASTVSPPPPSITSLIPPPPPNATGLYPPPPGSDVVPPPPPQLIYAQPPPSEGPGSSPFTRGSSTSNAGLPFPSSWQLSIVVPLLVAALACILAYREMRPVWAG